MVSFLSRHRSSLGLRRQHHTDKSSDTDNALDFVITKSSFLKPALDFVITKSSAVETTLDFVNTKSSAGVCIRIIVNVMPHPEPLGAHMAAQNEI